MAWATLEWGALALALGAALSIVWCSLRLGITPTPSAKPAQQAILQLLAQEKPQHPAPDQPEILYELGAGWGSLAFPIAQAYPGWEIRALEASPVPWLWMKLRYWLTPHPKLHIHRRNFFDTSLDDASFVVCYLYTGAMKRLRHKFEQECTPGTLVLTHTFSIPGWEAERVITLKDLYRSRVYLYRVPAPTEYQERS